MVNTDNIIPFPVPKLKTHFVDLVDIVVYSDRGYLVPACYCLDCKIVHICGHQPTSNGMYEMVEELDEGYLWECNGKPVPVEDHLDLVVGRLNRQQGRVGSHSMLLPPD